MYAAIASRLTWSSLDTDWSFTGFGFEADFFGSRALRLDMVVVLRMDEVSVEGAVELCLVEEGMVSGG